MEKIIEARRVDFAEIQPLRDLYRHEQHCQIVRDSILGRGLADAYLLLKKGRVAGYGGVRNKHDPNRVMEFYVLPAARVDAGLLFRALIKASGATSIEAQTNNALQLTMLYDCAENITPENVIFADAQTTTLTLPNGTLRPLGADESARVFAHTTEPVGDYAIEADGEIVATGGFLSHYNPPYADIYMEVAEAHRQRGYGSFLVQELKRLCYEQGKKPAARCTVSNFG